MSTIVVVRRGATACIACDTLANLGSTKQKAHYSSAPGKIFTFGDSLDRHGGLRSPQRRAAQLLHAAS
jgi:ATP-dependent protease HslVU (ClpYQ) peptidase subunit